MSSRPFVLGVVVVGVVAGCGDVEEAPPDRDVECGPGGASVQVLANGGFDDPAPPWTQDPVNLLCDDEVITPDTGTLSACLGGTDGTVRTVSQTVPLPAGASSVTLTGKICITTVDTTAVAHDTLVFELLNGNAVIATIGQRSNLNGVSACSYETLTLTAPVTSDPETATLRIRSTLDQENPTSFFIDSLSLDVGCDL